MRCGRVRSLVLILLTVAGSVSSASYFIHLSDPHIDFRYTENASIECTLLREGWPCCHDLSPNLSAKLKAPRYGHHHCDIPRETFEAMVEGLATAFPHPFLVLLTGDLTSHDAFYEYPEHIAQKLDFVFTTVKKHFGKSVKIITTIGNHDVFPADQASDNKTDEAVSASAEVMYKHGVIHKKIPDEDVFKLRGYYKTSIPNSSVDVIVMNNILDLTLNRFSDPNNRDPAGMYSWMEKKVMESACARRKVWLVGHVAPGVIWQLQRGVSVIERLIEDYGRNGTITRAFYGHTHMDEFVLTGMESLQDRAEFVSILAPGMTTKSNTNPSVRAVIVKGKDLELVDWYQYHFYLNASNKEKKPVFKHAYTFRKWLDVPDMSPQSFQLILQRILTNETYAVNYLNMRVSRTDNYKSCNEECRQNYYCTSAFAESRDLRNACLNMDYNSLVKLTLSNQ